MSAIYLGFDLQSMLGWLNQYCQRVELVKQGESWRLYVFSEKHGEYENCGSLFMITTKAFKPFVEQAKKDRAHARQLINDALSK